MRSNNFRWHLFLVFLIAFLSSCQPATSSPRPLPAVTPFRVALSPSLSWFVPHLNFCAVKQQDIGIVLDNAIPPEPDIRFTWGETTIIQDKSVFALGEDELLIVVNSKNPLKSIDISKIQDVFQGRTRTWKSVSKTAENLGNIEVFTYPDSLDVQRLFSQSIMGGAFRNSSAYLMPNPQAVRMAVAASAPAIGFIPRRWLVVGLIPLEIQNLDSKVLKFPILAVLPNTPHGSIQTWLLCLQSEVK